MEVDQVVDQEVDLEADQDLAAVHNKQFKALKNPELGMDQSLVLVLRYSEHRLSLQKGEELSKVALLMILHN